MSLILLLAQTAAACGGLFCDNVEPVVQTAERLLFHVQGNGEIDTYVEVQYAGPPSDFGWVLPVPGQLLADEVRTAPAGLFDELELATAPRFTPGAMGVAGSEAGCGCGGAAWTGGLDTASMMEAVDVVGAAVVGPYSLEVLDTDDANALVFWLQQNGYQYPASATPLFEHYVDADMQFVAVKLLADTPAGPIDTLVLPCASATPMIPLMLTSVAAADDMELTAYVLASERYGADSWPELEDDVPHATTTEEHEWYLSEAIDAAGGQAWLTEYAQPIDRVLPHLSDAVTSELGGGAYLTRLHSFASAGDMTSDPTFAPRPTLGDVDMTQGLAGVSSGDTGGSAAVGLGWAALLWWRRRQR